MFVNNTVTIIRRNMENKIVKNNSKGYGYNYASLSDIANQGYEIPKMTTGTDVTTGKDYVYYLDGNNWLRGAEIVIPEGKMNKAQLYGSALTYARRYTVLMALGLCCDDDKTIEELNADGSKKASNMSKNDKVKELEKLFTTKEINQILANYNAEKLLEIEDSVLDKYINFKKYGQR